jgi:hypothetical protein
VAKLGSAGIVAELRGVSRIYPSLLGEPHVWVEADELADARELITTDVDDVLAAAPEVATGGRSLVLPLVALVALALILLVSFATDLTRGGSASPPVTSASR